jgi:transcription elongation GreA/GreB family factor
MTQIDSTHNYYILEEDKALARQRVTEIEREILELGPAFHDALNQTSETWHDNAPFDALREKQSLLAAELQSLKEVLNKSSPSLPRSVVNRINIGSRVRLQHTTKKSQHDYLLAGHWSFRTGQVHQDNALVITCQSPLGESLLGKAPGDVVTLPNKQAFTILDITA